MFRRSRNVNGQGPWNKGRLVSKKSPLTAQEIWSIRMRLIGDKKQRDLALFNLALDSKLRACDLLKIRVSDISRGDGISSRAIVQQQKTGRPVQFEITRKTAKSISDWIEQASLAEADYLFPNRIKRSHHLSARRYVRIVESWVAGIGLNPTSYGTHSMRRKLTYNVVPRPSGDGRFPAGQGGILTAMERAANDPKRTLLSVRKRC